MFREDELEPCSVSMELFSIAIKDTVVAKDHSRVRKIVSETRNFIQEGTLTSLRNLARTLRDIGILTFEPY